MWRGSHGFCGVMDSGKSFAGARWLMQAPRGGIFWDPTLDARVPGAVDVDLGSRASLVMEALRSGAHLCWRSGGQRYQAREVTWIILALRRLGGYERPVRRVLFDEFHRLARTGRVHPEIAQEWYEQRHHSLEMGWTSPLVEAVDYEIVRTTVYLRVFRQPWRPWMQGQGFSSEMLDALARAPDYSSYLRDLRSPLRPALLGPGA